MMLLVLMSRWEKAVVQSIIKINAAMTLLLRTQLRVLKPYFHGLICDLIQLFILNQLVFTRDRLKLFVKTIDWTTLGKSLNVTLPNEYPAVLRLIEMTLIKLLNMVSNIHKYCLSHSLLPGKIRELTRFHAQIETDIKDNGCGFITLSTDFSELEHLFASHVSKLALNVILNSCHTDFVRSITDQTKNILSKNTDKSSLRQRPCAAHKNFYTLHQLAIRQLIV